MGRGKLFVINRIKPGIVLHSAAAQKMVGRISESMQFPLSGTALSISYEQISRLRNLS